MLSRVDVRRPWAGRSAGAPAGGELLGLGL